MKKAFLTILAVIALASAATAQNNLGVRINVDGNYGYGAGLSYQHGFSDANRLELDFGWFGYEYHTQLSATGIYQWTFNIVGDRKSVV